MLIYSNDLRLKRHVEAADTATELLNICEAQYCTNHPETANALKLLSGPLIWQQELDKASDHLEKAVEILRATTGLATKDGVECPRSLSQVLYHRDLYEKALVVVEEELLIRRDSVEEASSTPKEMFDAVSHRAWCLKRIDRMPEAIDCFNSALEIADKHGIDEPLRYSEMQTARAELMRLAN